MNRIPHIPLLLALGSCVALAEEPALQVAVNRTEIFLGESLIMEVGVTGSASSEDPDLSALSSCQIRPRGSHSSRQMSFSFTNGRVQRSESVTRISVYEITPSAAGVFRAGPIRVNVGGRQLRDEGPTISVVGIEQQDRVLIEIAPSRDTVLLDEPFDITFSLRIRSPAGSHTGLEPLDPAAPPALTVQYLDGNPIKGLKGPDVRQVLSGLLIPDNQPGITINDHKVQRRGFDFNDMFNFDFANPFGEKTARFGLPRQTVERDGKTCFDYRLTLTFHPEEEGNYTFGPALFKGPVISAVSAEGAVSRQNIFAVGPACTIRVAPPPDEGRPADFIGTIGRGLIAEAALDTQTCKVGDPLTLTLTISGDVRLDRLLPPRLNLQTTLTRDFVVYDDTVETVKREAQREYLYKLRPLRAGTIEVPPLTVSYYDTTERKYRTAMTQPIPLKVRVSEEIGADQVIADTNRIQAAEAERQPEVRPVASLRTDPRGARPQSLTGGPGVLWLAVSGPLLFGLTVTARGLIRYQARHSVRRRQKNAFRGARAALREAGRLSRSHPERARAAAYAAFQKCLADRFGFPASSLTPDDARNLLRRHRVPEDLAADFTRLMDALFHAAYSESGGSTQVEALCAEGISLLRRAQDTLG